jgi:hypothetical protein
MEPAARPSVTPQRGADGAPSTSNAWQHPLRPTPPLARPSLPSPEELRRWIQKEVASRLAPYEHLLEEAKAVIAGKDVEIANLKAELEMVRAQQKLSEASAAEPASPTDPACQPGVQDWRHLQRELRQLRQVAKEALFLCNGMKEKQFRMGTELAVQQQEIVVLQKQLTKEEQAGAAHCLSEPLQEKGQNQQGNLHGWLDTADTVFVDEPEWPTPATGMGFQYTTRITDAAALPTQAFSFEDAANKQLPAFVSAGSSFVFQQPVPEAETPAPSCPTMQDGFVVALSGSNPERTPDSVRGAVGKHTPPRAAATRSRIKRHVSPGLNTPQEPAAKKGMVEEEEEGEDGTDADIGRWAAAEHMEDEHAEEDEEEAAQPSDQEQKRHRGEGAGARRGPLFESTAEHPPMGG